MSFTSISRATLNKLSLSSSSDILKTNAENMFFTMIMQGQILSQIKIETHFENVQRTTTQK